MKLKKSSKFTSKRSPLIKQPAFSASEQLTKSEIELLRQGKKRISDYIQKEFADLAPDAQAVKAKSGDAQ
jgi:hypothetical protein